MRTFAGAVRHRQTATQLGGEIAERVRQHLQTDDAETVANWFLTFATLSLLKLGVAPEVIHDRVIEATTEEEARRSSVLHT